MISLMVQYIIHLLLCQIVFFGIEVNPVIMVHARSAAKVPSISAVKDRIQIREENFCCKRGAHMIRCIAVRHTGALFTASGKYHVIGAACHCEYGFFQCNISGTAALRVRDGTFPSHSEPVSDLKVWGDTSI